MNVGSVAAERFEIEQLAGSGGMGTVWRARDRTTGEAVALKIMQKKGAPELGRFLREGKALAELQHPAIVRYIAHGVMPTGDAYLAMEWLEGEDLETRLGAHGLTLAESVEVVRRLSEGLAVAHARSLVHRDIKPNNVFLVGGDIAQVKLLDFGVVRLADPGGRTALTLPGTMLGTPGYMAPEQVRGVVDVDARADVFALGCVLYNCLTGKAAFGGSDPIASLTRVLFDDPIPPSRLREGISPRLEALVMRMLAKNPDGRPRDAAVVAAELGELRVTMDGGRAPLRDRLEALTGGEQRVVSIVVASPVFVVPAGAGTEATLTPRTPPPELRARVEGLGARFEALANGAFVVVSSGAGTAADHAVQAARCALALRDALPDAPIAVATGRSDASAATPAGEVIRRAVELLRGAEESMAMATIADGSRFDALSVSQPTSAWFVRPVRIDDVTAGLLGGRFEIASDGMTLELRRERTTSETSRTLLGRETPCVGRERELSSLLGVYEECVAESVARAVLVTAPAGIGKSRVRHEFLRRLRARGEKTVVWSGRADPRSAGSPFGMLAGALSAALGLQGDDPLELRQSKLAAGVARRVPASEASRVTEFLGELLGVPFPDESSVPLRAARQDAILRGDQMRRAWEDLLVAECRESPVVLVLDDLHWGDVPTVRFVDAALRNAQGCAFMVLALGRPEVHQLFPSLWSERGVQSIHLGELTRKASEKLVRSVLGDEASPESIGRVVDRAAGNAFYLEELIRAVAEGKRNTLPETVIAMVQARLEAVDPEGRRVLRAASVFGGTFWVGGVRALLGGAARTAHLDEWLRHLEDRELVVRSNASRFRDEHEYTFRHSLLSEAAYAMLTENDRTLGHKLAGEWLTKAGESSAVVLAEHCERSGQRDRAVGLYQRAAAQALEGNDFAAVIERARRGVACGAEGPATGALLLLEAEAQHWRGDFVEAERCAFAARESLPPGDGLRFAALAEAAVASGKLGHNDRLVTVAEELRSASPDSETTMAAYVVATARTSAQLMFAGRYAASEGLIEQLERALAASSADSSSYAGWVADCRSTRAMQAGDMAACLEEMDRSAKSFEQTGDLRNACTERGYVGYAYLELGLYAEAATSLREALVVAERMGLSPVAAAARHNLGLALAREGKLEEGLATERLAAEQFRIQGDQRLEAASRNYLAQILMMAGDTVGAEREARAGLALGAERPMAAGSFAVLSIVLLAQGRAAESLTAAREGMRMLRDLGVVEEGQARVGLAYAEALAANGATEEARSALAAARSELLARADKIGDPAARASFLENVPENARMGALARAWAITKG